MLTLWIIHLKLLEHKIQNSEAGSAFNSFRTASMPARVHMSNDRPNTPAARCQVMKVGMPERLDVIWYNPMAVMKAGT